MASQGEAAFGSKKQFMVVAAIDLGTAYSGCAYSFRNDWEKDPLKIFSKNFLSRSAFSDDDSSVPLPISEDQQSQPGQLSQTEKVPTTVLFNAEKQFVAFGYEAENEYTKLRKSDEEKAKTWYYFSQFKMKLHTQSVLRRDMQLRDYTSKPLPAIKVFSAAIKYLKDHVLAADATIHEDDVEWVLTIPAIWTDEARQFMREAAREAGIPDERLSLALEPEAASVLCLEEDRRQGHLNIHQPGSRFMVVDNGGGTVDITIYEVVDPKTNNSENALTPNGDTDKMDTDCVEPPSTGVKGILKELHHPTGGPCAGVQVDKAFKDLLKRTTSMDAITNIDKLEILDMERDFEQIKKDYHMTDDCFIKLPDSALENMKEAINRNEVADAKNISILRNRIKVPKKAFEELFCPTVKKITEYMERVLKNVSGPIETILLVGGFSDCLLLQTAVREKFDNVKVLIPLNPGAAVLKGAVLIRQNPSVIGWRASAFTYGIEVDEPFIQGRHKKEKAHWVDGKKKARCIFATFIGRNQIVAVGSVAKSEILAPCEVNQKELILPIFKSDTENPVHTTDEGCRKLGEVKVQLQGDVSPEKTEVRVEMLVGGTELIVRASNVETREMYSAVCDFLCK